MAEYQPVDLRFGFQGLCLNAPLDALPPGKFWYAENIRSYVEGTLQPREGYGAPLNAGALGASIHSLGRLNDPTAAASVAAIRLAGVGANLYQENVGSTTWTNVDAGYSGNPLVFLSAMAPQAVQPWMYVADSLQLRKINSAGTVYRTGILPPMTAATEPTAVLNQVASTIPDHFEVAGTWTSVSGAVAMTWGALAAVNRVNTTIATIVYDSGNTGYATVAPTALDNINEGMVLHVAAAEYAIVTGITIAIASTTIAAITYDTGATGLCTIQPAASLGVGQLEGPIGDVYRLRAGSTGAVPRSAGGQADLPLDPATAGTTAHRSTRQADFPVHCLVTLNAAETVQILAVALGQDGVLSFRCSTAGTFAAGQTITGTAGVRMFLTGTRAAGNALVDSAIAGTVTCVPPTGSTTVPGTVGINAALTPNLAQVTNAATTRAVLPDDIVHLSIKSTNLAEVQNVRVYLDVRNGGTPYAKDYFFFEWRQNDIQAAIQTTNAATTTNLVTAQQTAITNQLISEPVSSASGSGAVPRSSTTPPTQGTGTPTATEAAPGSLANQVAVRRPPTTSVGPNAGARSNWLTIGNNEWIELTCKVRDLIRIGSDSTRTLANVGGVEILVSTIMDVNGMGLSFGDLYIAGGFDLDVGNIGAPYSWRYRYRSTITGVVSNPSPPLRGGVTPKRQSVGLTATISSDAQVNAVDWFRLGGTLTAWTYVASGANDGAVFTDTFGDSAVVNGQLLDFDNFPPWPTTDIPHSGVVNVSGTSVSRVSGDNFNVNWSAGSVIVINGVVCTLYASPTSTSRLYVNENLGALTSVKWYSANATLLGTPLPILWGDFTNGLYFGCGDPDNTGTLYWTKKDNPEIASDANTLIVTSASEPLMNGYIEDGTPFVFSSDNLYAIERDGSVPGGLRHQITPCNRGLWTRWAFDASAPEGTYFLSKDGIYLTQRGGPAQSITDADLRPLFPHDGSVGQTVNGISPPDLTATAEKFRLTYVAGMLYFDYVVSGGASHTLAYDTRAKRWYYDTYAANIRSRLWEPGQAISSHIIGTTAGNIHATGGASDNGSAIAGTFKTPLADGNAPRLEKVIGDYILKCDPNAIAGGIAVTVGYNDFTTTLAPVTVGTGLSGEQLFTQDLSSGTGILARNVGLSVTWSSATAIPIFYLWQPSWLAKAPTTFKRATDWDALGSKTSKYIRAVWIRADTGGVTRTVQVQYDGGTVGATLSVTDSGERLVPYPIPAPCFVANLVRLVPTDASSWRLLDWYFEFDDYPALIAEVTTWQNAGYIGAKFIRAFVLDADTNNLPVTFDLQGDGGAVVETFSGTHNGRQEKPYAVGDGAVASLFRIVPATGMRVFQVGYIFDPYPELIPEATAWEDAGTPQNKYVQGIILTADTGNQPVTIQIQKDGGVVAATLTVTQNGKASVAYSFPTPFFAHQLRIVPLGNIRIWPSKWVYDATPEFALVWTTQRTNHDVPGFMIVRDLIVAYSAAGAVNLTITSDLGSATYALDGTGGVYGRIYLRVAPLKGKSFQYSWSSDAAFQLFKNDTVVRVWPWGSPGEYQAMNPFGGPSRVTPAEI